jgi:recombination protein RecA
MKEPKEKKIPEKGKMTFKSIQNLINKKSGHDVAFKLSESPTEVKDWIPTGSSWLDRIICKGKVGGIPVSKVVEIAGLSASSKSFMALQIAANAQKKGIQVIYFDSEMAVDPSFAEKFGIDLNNFMLVQAINVETVLESIADIMKESTDRYLFIWDSLAMTVCRDQNGGMAEKARIISNKLPELLVPLADTQSTFLVLNQLKANITSNAWEALSEPYMTPGGKTGIYAYSLRIWLTKRASKSSFVEDENGYRIGSEVKVTLKKSRFGTENRQCAFKILWGDSHKVGILDEESWLEAIRNSEFFVVRHGWRDILAEDKVTTQFKFQEGDFIKKLEAEPEFKKRILEILDYEMIYKFENKIGDAKTFSNIDNISDDAPEPIHQEEEE